MDEWADGCEAAAPFNSAQSGATGGVSTTSTICVFNVDFTSGAIMTIARHPSRHASTPESGQRRDPAAYPKVA